MQNQRIEDQAGKLLNNLPDRATWNNVICRIYVRQAIEAGIKDRTWGRTERSFLYKTLIGFLRSGSLGPKSSQTESASCLNAGLLPMISL